MAVRRSRSTLGLADPRFASRDSRLGSDLTDRFTVAYEELLP